MPTFAENRQFTSKSSLSVAAPRSPAIVAALENAVSVASVPVLTDVAMIERTLVER